MLNCKGSCLAQFEHMNYNSVAVETIGLGCKKKRLLNIILNLCYAIFMSSARIDIHIRYVHIFYVLCSLKF